MSGLAMYVGEGWVVVYKLRESDAYFLCSLTFPMSQYTNATCLTFFLLCLSFSGEVPPWEFPDVVSRDSTDVSHWNEFFK